MKVSIECGDGNSPLIIEALLGQSLTGQVPQLAALSLPRHRAESET